MVRTQDIRIPIKNVFFIVFTRYALIFLIQRNTTFVTRLALMMMTVVVVVVVMMMMMMLALLLLLLFLL